MQPTGIVSGVSFRQNLREGQLQSLEHENVLNGTKLNIKLPTGYGKTYTACGVYSIRQHHQLASRLLYVVPSTGQLDQFIACAPNDLALASVIGERIVTDIGFVPEAQCIKRHRRNECQVFTTTVQYLIQGGFRVIRDLLEQGVWMLVIDEYHHYGMEKEWGKRILQLPVSFLLAMSATPDRPKEDSAFGKPHVRITYQQGVDEGALKPLRGHAYDYRIDAVDEEGTVTTYTTTDLISEAGGESPELIERHFRIKRKMRWSPKYVSPLVREPIDRMMDERQRTGQHQLQVLITAMCVSHAELVCGQLRGMYPNLRIDWVGTGDFGRSKEENEATLARFCPPKPSSPLERRANPSLDVLVHVGMAGEGLDVTNVSEVVMLCPASFSNKTYQIVGRAGRYLKDYGADNTRSVVGHVNFDGSTELARGIQLNGTKVRAVGRAMIAAMDLLPPPDEGGDDGGDDDGDGDWPIDLPPEPVIQIVDMELIGIDSGDEGVRLMARVMEATSAPNSTFINFDGIKADNNHPDWERVKDIYIKMRDVEARAYNEKAVVAQWQDAVEGAVSNVANVTIKLMAIAGARIEKSLVGDIKKRINTRKKASCGAIAPEIEVLRTHYAWTVALAKQLRGTKELPAWLK